MHFDITVKGLSAVVFSPFGLTLVLSRVWLVGACTVHRVHGTGCTDRGDRAGAWNRLHRVHGQIYQIRTPPVGACNQCTGCMMLQRRPAGGCPTPLGQPHKRQMRGSLTPRGVAAAYNTSPASICRNVELIQHSLDRYTIIESLRRMNLGHNHKLKGEGRQKQPQW